KPLPPREPNPRPTEPKPLPTEPKLLPTAPKPLPEQQQGQVRQVRHRLPTPEPDTIERIYVRRTGAEIVEEITEVPTTPPPILKERTVVEPAGPPKVVKHVIRVPPRGGSYGGQFQQQGANVHYSDNLLNA
ncbi:unnamed protein product, partial [Rotaria sp. Silwood1]